MKKLLKMIKPWDVIIVTALVILSFLPLAIFSYQNNAAADVDEDEESLYVVVSADGEVVSEMELKNDHTREVYEYEDEKGNKNVIYREGEHVHMHDANCTDQLCVQQGEISEEGDTIVCLPHKVLVEIVSDNPSTDGDVDVISQ